MRTTSMTPRRCLHNEDYLVGWICALPVELAATINVLDERHHDLPQPPNDPSVYILGSIGDHNIVIVCLPAGQTGTNSASAIVNRMRLTFTSIRFGFLIGIGGGVPSQADIRLGDVVVSQPTLARGGVVQYDFGKSTLGGFERTGFLSAPPEILLNALAKYQAENVTRRGGLLSHPFNPTHTSTHLQRELTPDILFEPGYNHITGPTCQNCDLARAIQRPIRRKQETIIHYGTIASGNQVIKNAIIRDQLSSDLGGVLCFEMEAAGVMNTFPCLVIRGICGKSCLSISPSQFFLDRASSCHGVKSDLATI